MFSIGVYVTSRYKAYNTFSEYMDGCIKKFISVGKPSALVTGDYKTTDAGNGLVAKYAFEHNIPLRRFATMWEKHNPTKPDKRNNAGVASNAQIVKNSNGCVLFWTPTSVAKWDFMSGGCRSFLRMCDAGHLARPLIKIKVDIYAPDKEKMPEEIPTEVGEQPQSNEIGDISGTSPSIGGGGDAPSLSFGGGGGAAPLSIGGGSGSSQIPTSNNETEPPDNVDDTVGGVESTDDATADTVSNMGNISQPSSQDSVGNIDIGNPSAPNTVGSIISQIPIDTNGDGSPDTSVSAIDTDGNGSPDSIVTPIDTDNNGTIDKLSLSPIHTAGQIVAQNYNAMPQQRQVVNNPSSANAEDGKNKNITS